MLSLLVLKQVSRFSPSLPSRRLEQVQKLPRGSLVALEDTIVRHVFLIKGERVTLNDIYSRDGQKVEGNYMGGVITNLHLPRDWWILEVELSSRWFLNPSISGKMHILAI